MATSFRLTDDADLWVRMRDGEEEAFLAIYRRHQASIYRFALRMSGSDAVAEDVTQEVFLALMRDAAPYDASRGPLSSFLYGVARNLVHRALQKTQAWVPMSGEAAEEGDYQAGEARVRDRAFEDLARKQDVERVRKAVLSLPGHYREVVVLCELDEMSYEQASAILGCALGTVRSRLNRARGLLIEKLAPGAARRMAAGRLEAAENLS